MKTKLLIIIGIVLIVGILSTVILNDYISVQREFELENTPDQLKGILGSCACQERTKSFPESNERCPQSFIDWQNSTHYIDNNICEWREIENEN